MPIQNLYRALGGMKAHRRPVGRTLLATWMKSHHVTCERLALAIPTSVRNVEYWKRGQTMPSLVYAALIERVTSGGVPISSWLGTDLARMQLNSLEEIRRGKIAEAQGLPEITEPTDSP